MTPLEPVPMPLTRPTLLSCDGQANRGAVCNLDCSYCVFLSKEVLYPGGMVICPAFWLKNCCSEGTTRFQEIKWSK